MNEYMDKYHLAEKIAADAEAQYDGVREKTKHEKDLETAVGFLVILVLLLLFFG